MHRSGVAWPSQLGLVSGQTSLLLGIEEKLCDLCPALAASSQDPMTPLPLFLRGSLVPSLGMWPWSRTAVGRQNPAIPI